MQCVVCISDSQNLRNSPEDFHLGEDSPDLLREKAATTGEVLPGLWPTRKCQSDQGLVTRIFQQGTELSFQSEESPRF